MASERPSAAEFMARWTVDAATNMDVGAEARGRPRVKFRPDGADFAAAELAPAENKPADGAQEEAVSGTGALDGAEVLGLAQEAEDGEVAPAECPVSPLVSVADITEHLRTQPGMVSCDWREESWSRDHDPPL